MAEGGGEFGYKAPELDYAIDNDEDDEQEVNRTQKSTEPNKKSTEPRLLSRRGLQPPISIGVNTKCNRCKRKAGFPILLMKKPLFCLVQTETQILKEGLPL